MAITKLPRSGIADNAIDASKIEDGTIAIAEVSGTISNAKIKDGEIANAKLSNSAITIRGVSRSLGSSLTIGINLDWQSKVTSDGSTVTTMVAGQGYFVDNSSAAGIVKLPASATIGDTIAIKDYAGNFGTNNLTIQRNGHKIQGNSNNSVIKTNRASVELVYADATKGWLFSDESNVADLQAILYVTATGGTVATSGDYKIHSFTSDGNFVVSCAGTAAGNNKVDYLVIGGGGGAGSSNSGGGGAGGFRESYTPSVSGPYTASPLKASCGALTMSAQTYPVTVGGGGTGGGPGHQQRGTGGSNSVFSTITSAGGGEGHAFGNYCFSAPAMAGGSGGGGGGRDGTGSAPAGGVGNTPPVSPPQGNNGGNGVRVNTLNAGGGGGGAGAAGGNASNCNGANGGSGVSTSITTSSVTRAGGGGGSAGGGINHGASPSSGQGSGGSGGGGSATPQPGNGGAGSANTGSGGGGGSGTYGLCSNKSGGNGGKGFVVIRYKFQN